MTLKEVNVTTWIPLEGEPSSKRYRQHPNR